MGTRVKNLHGTSNCPHYRRKGVQDAISQIKGCANNGCSKKGNGEVKICQAHVIKANQNAATGIRYLVPFCTSCNQSYNGVLEVDGRLEDLVITGCECGTL